MLLTVIVSLITAFVSYVIYVHLDKRIVELQKTVESLQVKVDKESNTQLCVVKTLRYADGFVAEKHSQCGNIPLVRMTEQWAQTIYPQAKLINITTTEHKV